MKNNSDFSNKRIVISRTDSIGDVMLTLPICYWIKTNFPTATVIFLGKGYTLPILRSYSKIDEIVDWNDFNSVPTAQRTAKIKELNADIIIHVFPNKEIAALAKRAKIPQRIGTSHRNFHLLTCNIRPNFSRKKSDFHEAQLNHELLKPFGLIDLPTMDELNLTTADFKPKNVGLPSEIERFISVNKKCFILHPKSQGSAVEWPMEKYLDLTQKLIDKNIAVMFTGTSAEGEIFSKEVSAKFENHPNVMNTAGLLTLNQLMELISKVEGIVACSTGPLHIAGFLGVKAVGLFSLKRPIHPGRWMPLGNNVSIITSSSKNKKQSAKTDIENIKDENVFEAIGLE